VSLTSRADGSLHLTGVVPGSGVWYRYRTGTTWAPNAQKIDENQRIFATTLAALPNGSLHVANLVDVS
jgi:hypothetical protein